MPLLKHGETGGDVTSLTSPNTESNYFKEVRSLSLCNLNLNKNISNNKEKSVMTIKTSSYIWESFTNLNYEKYSKCQILSDVCHGKLLFTAAYYKKKKM